MKNAWRKERKNEKTTKNTRGKEHKWKGKSQDERDQTDYTVGVREKIVYIFLTSSGDDTSL